MFITEKISSIDNIAIIDIMKLNKDGNFWSKNRINKVKKAPTTPEIILLDITIYLQIYDFF